MTCRVLWDEPCLRWGYRVTRVTPWGECGAGDPGLVQPRSLCLQVPAHVKRCQLSAPSPFGLAQHHCMGWWQPKKAMLRLRGCGRSRMRPRAVGFFGLGGSCSADPVGLWCWGHGAGASSVASCPARVKPQPGHCYS